MRIEETIALISINETLFVQLISFLIFLFIIKRLMFQPLRNVMAQREQHISRVQLEIKGTRAELDGAIARMKEQEKNIRAEATAKREELEALGEKEALAIFNSVREQIHKEKQKVQEQIDAEIEDAKIKLKSQSEILSVSIIEKVLERRLA